MDNDLKITTKRKQTDISVLFGGKSIKTSHIDDGNIDKSNKLIKTRSLSLITAKGWLNNSLAQYDAKNWLILILDKADENSVEILRCSICKKYEHIIGSIKNFSSIWGSDGTRQVKLSAAKEHATSEPHKKVYDLFMKDSGIGIVEQTEGKCLYK